ncbi:MAG: adenine phosphoribosyltransferase [Armatimonadetes bacterium]|nr:adenine phosphoribosyltransferase [Armatimonadota bacterium]
MDESASLPWRRAGPWPQKVTGAPNLERRPDRLGADLGRGVSCRAVSELLAAQLIRDVPDFPKPGILFKDVAPVMMSAPAMQEVVDLLADDAKASGAEVIVGIESRGFVFGVPVALQLGLPFAMTRKLGKLPFDRITEEYALEYGTNTIEMHVDAIDPGQRAYIIDDLLATGGTAAAAARLIERLNGSVCGMGFMVELVFLEGRKNLLGYQTRTLIQY